MKNHFPHSLTALILLFSFSTCKSAVPATPASPEKTVTQAYTDTLTVAPYLYVPRLNQFIAVMREMWAQLHPETYLQVETKWDCYSQDPPDSIDVFVYDGIFFNYFNDKGYLSEIPASAISDPDDVLDYALQAGRIYDSYYSLPQIGCGNILFWRAGDAAVAQATSTLALYNVIGPATFPSVKPPPGKGLLIDLSGGTTNACFDVATDMQRLNYYSTVNPPQSSCGTVNPGTLDSLQLLVKMAGHTQASTYGGDYSRAKWFGQGSGQAVVGFTEYLCYMDYDVDEVAFKPLPVGGAEFTPFYIDLVAVNAKVSAAMKNKAYKLADLLSTSAYETAAFGPDSTGIPQYLMPIRWSVFEQLGAKFPLYKEMEKMVRNANPRAFLLNANARSWLEANKNCIRYSVLNGVAPDPVKAKGK